MNGILILLAEAVFLKYKTQSAFCKSNNKHSLAFWLLHSLKWTWICSLSMNSNSETLQLYFFEMWSSFEWNCQLAATLPEDVLPVK